MAVTGEINDFGVTTTTLADRHASLQLGFSSGKPTAAAATEIIMEEAAIVCGLYRQAGVDATTITDVTSMAYLYGRGLVTELTMAKLLPARNAQDREGQSDRRLREALRRIEAIVKQPSRLGAAHNTDDTAPGIASTPSDRESDRDDALADLTGSNGRFARALHSGQR